MAKFNSDTVQAAINKLAEDRLKRDLTKISDFIQGNSLLNPSDNSKERPSPQLFEKLSDDTYKGSTPYWVFQHKKNGSSSGYMDKLFNYWLPVYIEQETKSFFERVDQLQANYEELLSMDRDQ